MPSPTVDSNSEVNKTSMKGLGSNPNVRIRKREEKTVLSSNNDGSDDNINKNEDVTSNIVNESNLDTSSSLDSSHLNQPPIKKKDKDIDGKKENINHDNNYFTSNKIPNTNIKENSREARRARRRKRREERKAERLEADRVSVSGAITLDDSLKNLAKKKLDSIETKTHLQESDLQNKIDDPISSIHSSDTELSKESNKLKESSKLRDVQTNEQLEHLNQRIHAISEKSGIVISRNDENQGVINKDDIDKKLKEALTNTMMSAGLDAKMFDMMDLTMIHAKYRKYVEQLQKREEEFDFRKGMPSHSYKPTNWLKSAAENVGFIFAKMFDCIHEPDLSKSYPPKYVCIKCGDTYYKDEIKEEEKEADNESEKIESENKRKREKVRRRFNPDRIRNKLLKAKLDLRE